jgi:hypothetical protein
MVDLSYTILFSAATSQDLPDAVHLWYIKFLGSLRLSLLVLMIPTLRLVHPRAGPARAPMGVELPHDMHENLLTRKKKPIWIERLSS